MVICVCIFVYADCCKRHKYTAVLSTVSELIFIRAIAHPINKLAIPNHSLCLFPQPSLLVTIADPIRLSRWRTLFGLWKLASIYNNVSVGHREMCLSRHTISFVFQPFASFFSLQPFPMKLLSKNVVYIRPIIYIRSTTYFCSHTAIVFVALLVCFAVDGAVAVVGFITHATITIQTLNVYLQQIIAQRVLCMCLLVCALYILNSKIVVFLCCFFCVILINRTQLLILPSLHLYSSFALHWLFFFVRFSIDWTTSACLQPCCELLSTRTPLDWSTFFVCLYDFFAMFFRYGLEVLEQLISR